ncbi:MAG: helix-turn-helix transcriptional regulator [Parvibaculaceae bacterium]
MTEQIHRLLTPKEAAARIGIGEDTLAAARIAGELPYVNIGRGTKRETPRYDPADHLDRQ